MGVGVGPDYLEETDTQTNAHYGDEIVVQPVLEVPLAALGMQKKIKRGFFLRCALKPWPTVLSAALTPHSGTAPFP